MTQRFRGLTMLVALAFVLAGCGVANDPGGGSGGGGSSTTTINAQAQTVYVTDTGTKFHRLGCQYLAQSSRAMSRSDAIAARYTACEVCQP